MKHLITISLSLFSFCVISCSKSMPVKEQTGNELLIIEDSKCLNGAVDLWAIRMERRLNEAYPAKQ